MAIHHRVLWTLAPFTLVAIVAACSSATDTSSANDARIAESRKTAQSEYEQALDDTSVRWSRCLDELEATGKCTISEPNAPRTLTIQLDLAGPRDWRDNLRKARQALGQVRQLLSDAKTKMCEFLAPFAGMQHPYFFMGGNATAAAGAGAQAGFDVVFDLWNQQAAVFTYKGVGLASLAGAEVSAYQGYGFGNKPNVIDAWSGRFCNATAGVGVSAEVIGIPVGAGVGGSLFASPDQSIVGGAVAVSGNVGFTPEGWEASVFAADWTAWDTGTKALGGTGFGYRDSIQSANGKNYVQYNSATDMAIAILWNVPTPQNVTVAAQVLALAAMKKTGLTLEQACPNEVAAAKPPKIELLEKACDAIPNPLNGSSSSSGGTSSGGSSSSSSSSGGSSSGGETGLSKTDCNDKSDGWWCLDSGTGTGWMAYCSGKQIAGGCGCAACTTAGTQASCSASPPPAACPSN